MNIINKKFSYGILWFILGLLTLAYNGAGIYCLIADTSFSYPIDLRLRWIEQSLLYQGLNPQEYGHPDPGLPSTHASMKNLGGSYPPWSYATSMLFVPPLDWNSTRCYFAALNILALFVIGFWAYRKGVEFGKRVAVVSLLSIGAIFSIAICLSYGQYAILITACLAMVLMFSEKGYNGLAGIWMGVAFVKPQLAALFFLSLFLKKKWRLVLTTLAYLGLASCITWILIGRDPVTMLRNMSREAELYYFLSHNPLLPLLVKSLGYKTATITLAASGIILCGFLVLFVREQVSELTLFSICAVVAMFWSYRKNYDCALLVFLIVNLLVTSYRTRSKALFTAFILCGASLWIPIRADQWSSPFIQYTHFALWICGLILLVFSERNREYRFLIIPSIKSV